MYRLPYVHKTSWQRPLTLEGFAATADQDHPRLRGDHHVDHQLRGLRSCQSSYLLRVRRIERLRRVVAGCIMLVHAARGKGLDYGPHPGRVAPHGGGPPPFASKTGDPLRKRVCSAQWQGYTHEDTLHQRPGGEDAVRSEPYLLCQGSRGGDL